MKKLKLNKKTISVLDKVEMGEIDGGFTCVVSCDRGTDNGKTCCKSGRVVVSISGRDNYTCTNVRKERPVDYVLVKDIPSLDKPERF